MYITDREYSSWMHFGSSFPFSFQNKVYFNLAFTVILPDNNLE